MFQDVLRLPVKRAELLNSERVRPKPLLFRRGFLCRLLDGTAGAASEVCPIR